MKTLYIISLIFGILSFGLFAQDCVDCLNNVDGMLPGDMSTISKLTAGISCAAAVEAPLSEDIFAPAPPKKDICDCVIAKNIDGIKEKSGKQVNRYKRAYAEMMASRFVVNAKRLSGLAHSLSLAHLDASSLAHPGGPCDIAQQFKSVSCFGSEKFTNNFKSLFGPEEKVHDSCKTKKDEELSSDELSCYWRGLGASGALGLLSDQKVTNKRCLDQNTLNLLNLTGERKDDDLIILSRFINRENGGSDKKFDFKKFDQLSRKLGSPRRAIKQMETFGSQYKDLGRLINRYPEIAGMFEAQGSFDLLKGIFSGDEAELKKHPERFLKKHFFGADNKNLLAVYQNIKKTCDDYRQDLDTFLCKDIGDSYIDDPIFVAAYVRDPGQRGEIDTLDDALICHARYCKEGKILENLEGYCRPNESGVSLNESLKEFSLDFEAKQFVRIEGSSKIQSGEYGIQADICRFLVCDDDSVKKCVKDNKGQMKRARDVLEELCPNGESKIRGENPLCSDDLYIKMNDLAEIQDKEFDSGMVEEVDVPDTSKPLDSEGNYPTQKEYHYKDGFSEHLWGVAGENPIVVPLAKASQGKGKVKDNDKKSSKGRKNKQTINKQDNGISAVAAPVSADIHRGSVPSSLSGESAQAKSLAKAAIDMAKNATEFSDRAARRIQKRLDRESKKITTAPQKGASEEKAAKSDESLDSGSSTPNNSFVPPATVASVPKGRQRSYRPARKLPTSVTDIQHRSPSSAGTHAGRSALPASFQVPKGISSGALGISFPPSNQVLSIAGKNLPSLKPNLLSENNIDPHKPFLMEVTIDGKVYKIEVKPFVFEGKLIHRPELDHLKVNKPELYRAIRKSPLFEEYLAFEKGQKVYKWNDVLKVLSKAETTRDNA